MGTNIQIGPTGQTVVGDVLDVNKDTLERLCKQVDSRLYIKWNPTKNNGYGLWELRIRPTHKSIIYKVSYQGNTYCILDYKENGFEHHVKDFQYLSYSILDWLRDADQWAMSNYEPDKLLRLQRYLVKMDDAMYAKKDKAKEKAREDMMYQIKQDKGIIKAYQEALLSGINPNELAKVWGKV